ncbi:MAG: hypothetical protein QOF77_194 [Solirubrobacteraceae bacterium]|jgi:hypothetical protein|nr:hypothetical protein [Solirubrobacteraceae bacterium]
MPFRRIRDEHEQATARRPSGAEKAAPASGSVRQPPASLAVRLTRYGLPAAILLAGAIIAVVVPGETGVDAVVGLSGVCACVVLLNLLLRLGASGDRDRVRESAAREYYDEHGRWPEEPGPAN